MIRTSPTQLFLFLLIFLAGFSCTKKSAGPEPTPVPEPFEYKTKNVVIVVVDGPRYTETWGDPNRSNIPNRISLLKEGVMCEKIYNNGKTSTLPGHTAICTGVYQQISNDGKEFPDNPSIFQYWRKEKNQPAAKAWLITTKDKLEVLSDCNNTTWKGQYTPMTDCGVNGLNTGYRFDAQTMEKVYTRLATDRPNLMVINFKQPDEGGHQGDSARYIKGIVDTDRYLGELWAWLQTDTAYKAKTTMFVTSDHGRHTVGYKDGIISHGDDCVGCRHIELLAMGPDFKRNFVSKVNYEQVDVTSTVAELLDFSMPTAAGKVMTDLFVKLKD